ncbi:MAG: PspC domain-containing protein [Geodermatophilaceae bacterium]
MTTQPEAPPGDSNDATAAGSHEKTAAGPYGPDTRSYPVPANRDVRMRRSAADKMLLGVCGGIAEHTDIDPVYIRLGFLVSLFWGGIGIFGYVAAALVMPKPQPRPVPVCQGS